MYCTLRTKIFTVQANSFHIIARFVMLVSGCIIKTALWALLFLRSRKLRNIPFSLHLSACRRMIRRIHVNRSLAVWLLHYTWFVPLLSGSLCLQAGPGGQVNSGWPLAQDMPPEVPAAVTKTRLARLRPRCCLAWYLPEKSSSSGRKA